MKTAAEAWPLLKRAFNEWSEDKAMRLSAALACYTIISLAPLVVISIKIVSLFSREAAGGLVEQQMTQLVGKQGGMAIHDVIQSGGQPGAGIRATIVSFFILLFSASGVFAELQDSMNTIWEVKPNPRMSWWDTLKKRFTSIGMVFAIVFLLLVSMIITAAIGTLMHHFFGGAGQEQQTWIAMVIGHLVDFVITTAVVAVLFTLIFMYLPDVKIRFKDVWLGGLLTAVLFKLGQYALSAYFSFGTTTSAYGAAGSLVAVLLWAYYSACILFFGAEVTRAYAKQYAPRLVPEDYAVPVTDEERAQHGMPRKKDLQESADAQAIGASQRGGFMPERLTTTLPKQRIVTITRPGPEAGKAYAVAGFGLAAGFVVGAVGLLAGRKYTAGGLEQMSLNERLNQLETRYGRGKALERRAREIAIEERLNMIQSHVRQATDSLRRRAKYYAKPTWTDRLSAYLSRN